MNIYAALKKDHDKVKGLLERLVHSADATVEARQKLIAQIRDELIPHSRAEEAVFYNSLRTLDKAGSLVLHGYQEHIEAETLLRTLQTMDAMHADWTVIAKKLQDALEHHISEEEGEIFTAAKKVLIAEEADVLGEVFEQMKPQIKEEGFIGTTVDLLVNAMPPRLTDSLRNFFNRS